MRKGDLQISVCYSFDVPQQGSCLSEEAAPKEREWK